MIRTERLLKLLQLLRTYRYSVSGQQLANRMNISLRTLYRDVDTLRAQGAEIDGEAGIGYVLKESFLVPPIVFSQTEIDALLLGIQWVSQYGDAPLSKAASDSLRKITATLPARVKSTMNSFALRVGPPVKQSLAKENLLSLREAIRNQNKINLTYQAQNERGEREIIWPFTIGYFTDCRILVGWNEKQKDYCHFDTSKIISFEILDESYPTPSKHLFREWQTIQLAKYE